MKQLGLYLHIPFCIKKCRYCDFLSYGGSTEDLHSTYMESLLCEIGRSETGLRVDTVFFGGGTPSLLSENHIDRILHSIDKQFTIDSDNEISLEANPGTISSQKLNAYRSMGINRLSIGAQSLDDGLLHYLGRVHSADDFRRCFADARKAGFHNINVDLMFGIPGQTLTIWHETLREVLTLQPEHISFYSLQLEEGTPFHKMYLAGTLKPVDDELDREMYRDVLNILDVNGYHHYEISNAARMGYSCRHNLKYWTMQEYLGFGLGAHSYRQGRRFGNETDLASYLRHPEAAWVHENSRQDEISEYLFTGLRLISGISLEDFRQNFDVSLWDLYGKEIKKHQENGLLTVDSTENRLRLTAKGIDLSNQVLMDFV